MRPAVLDPGRWPRRLPVLVLALMLALVAAACSSGDDEAPGDTPATTAADAPGDAADDAGGGAAAAPLPEGWEGHVSDTYADEANWLCRPGRDDDVCTGEDLDATAVAADGGIEAVGHQVADDPPVDCFYVYPTTSQDEGLGADLQPADNQEVWVARNQAARFSAACRVFAPVYRQLTVSAIGGGDTAAREQAYEIAYADVVDAFRHYVANDSDGRGFVLVGHSQGAGHLRRLIAEEVEPEPALRGRLVSALLLGTTVEVPEGEVMGGSFDDVPLCERDDQVGCVVSYATFRADEPPPPGSLFGRARTPGTEAACVNPAALQGGPAMLSPYFPTSIPEGALSGNVGDSMSRLAQLETGWVTMPDFVEAECVRGAGASYLALTIGGPDDIRGDQVGGVLTPEWGLHLVDVNVAIGDLVALVESQAEAYAG